MLRIDDFLCYSTTKLNVAKMSFNLDVTKIECCNNLFNVSYTRFYWGECIIFHVVKKKCEHFGFMIKGNYILMFQSLSLPLSCWWHHARAMAVCGGAGAMAAVCGGAGPMAVCGGVPCSSGYINNPSSRCYHLE